MINFSGESADQRNLSKTADNISDGDVRTETYNHSKCKILIHLIVTLIIFEFYQLKFEI